MRYRKPRAALPTGSTADQYRALAGAAPNRSVSGGSVNITAGSAGPHADGGNVEITAGSGAVNGNGGDIVIAAGSGGAPERGSVLDVRLAEEAVQLGRELGNAADSMKHSFVRAAEALAELRLGVSASVPINEDDHGWQQRLEFSKDGSNWLLTISTGIVGEPGSWSVSPVTSVSRETRVRAAAKLDELLDALLEEARQQIITARQSVDRIESFVDRVSKKPGRP